MKSVTHDDNKHEILPWKVNRRFVKKTQRWNSNIWRKKTEIWVMHSLFTLLGYLNLISIANEVWKRPLFYKDGTIGYMLPFVVKKEKGKTPHKICCIPFKFYLPLLGELKVTIIASLICAATFAVQWVKTQPKKSKYFNWCSELVDQKVWPADNNKSNSNIRVVHHHSFLY